MRLFHAEPGPLLHQLELALGNRSGRALSCHQYTIVDLRGGLLPSLLPATKRRHEACDERIVQIDTKVAQASAGWLTGGFSQPAGAALAGHGIVESALDKGTLTLTLTPALTLTQVGLRACKKESGLLSTKARLTLTLPLPTPNPNHGFDKGTRSPHAKVRPPTMGPS